MQVLLVKNTITMNDKEYKAESHRKSMMNRERILLEETEIKFLMHLILQSGEHRKIHKLKLLLNKFSKSLLRIEGRRYQ